MVPRKGSLLGFLSVLHHTSLVLLSEFSSSQLSSSVVLVSLSLVTATTEDHNCLCELVVEMSLSLSKLSLSLLSETSECVSAYNSHKVSAGYGLLPGRLPGLGGCLGHEVFVAVSGG